MVALHIVYLSDVVRAKAGWPIDLDAVIIVLEKADNILAADGGRSCTRPLTDDELEQFGVSRA